jgi:hypothetical protein
MLVNEVLGLSHYKTHANELDWRVVVGFGHSIGVSASGRGSWDPSWRCRKGNLPPDSRLGRDGSLGRLRPIRQRTRWARSCILSPSQINRREAGRRPLSHFGGTSVVQVQELARTLWIKCSVIDKVARGRVNPDAGLS